jgi:predicted NBD/HSP70 family sugar kinase
MTTPQPRIATTRVVTEINRTAILDALLEHGPLSRKQIVQRTGLSSATVERLSAALLSENLIAVDGLERSSGGRPSYLLRYAGSSRAVAAIEVSETAVRGRLVDFDGATVAEERIVFETGPSSSAATVRLEGTLALAEALVAAAAQQGRLCTGIGVSVPGIVHEGRVMNTVELGWREIPLGAIIETRTGIPTLVENDANAIAYGEWSQGAAVGTQSAASYVLGVGVGSGVVNDGAIYHGARSGAGEIGFLFADSSALRRYFTEQGDLETRIAAVAERSASGPAPAAMPRLIDAAAAGDPTVAAAADELFDLLAFSCGALATILDPEVIVLAGHLTRAPEYAIEQISKRLVGRIPFPPRLLAGSLGTDAALVGVGELIARHVRGSTYLAR